MKNTLLIVILFSIIGCTQENPKFDKLYTKQQAVSELVLLIILK